jgi:long-chain-fatty-acid---luciferin-component ligase
VNSLISSTATAPVAAPRPAAHRLKQVAIDATTNLDHLIFSDDLFDLPLAEQLAQREVHVREALQRHLQSCAPYAAYARRLAPGLDPASIDLAAIPVVPTAVFKGQDVISLAPEEIAKWCLSSGTRGPQSRIGRDRRTLERLLGSVRTGLSLIEEWHEDEMEMVHLGPDRREAGDIWFMYVMSLIELVHPTRHYVRNGEFDADGALARIVELLRGGQEHVAIVGAPFQIMELVETVGRKAARIDAGERMTVFSAGGWKRRSGEQIPRADFDRRVGEAFGLDSSGQVRDAFNQVELNTVFIECSSHRKHVPPWVYVAARDPERLQVLPPGTEGVLSYLDASAISYPAFIVTDDVGIVDEGLCPCGRTGVTMRVFRRLTRLAERGCALTLDRRAKR